MRVERQLDQIDILLDQSRLAQFAQVPGVPQPSGNRAAGVGSELWVGSPFVEVLTPLFDDRMQPRQLIESLL